MGKKEDGENALEDEMKYEISIRQHKGNTARHIFHFG